MTTKFDIDEEVYAIDHYHDDGKDIPSAIHKVTIVSIVIADEGEFYYVKGVDNEEWGDYVDLKYMSRNVEDLIPILKEYITLKHIKHSFDINVRNTELHLNT